LEGGSCSQVAFLLHDLKSALCQVTRFAGSTYPSAGLLQCILCISDFDADLFLQLFAAQFCLPVLEFGSKLVRLSDAVSNRNIQTQSNVVIRRRIVESIGESSRKIRGHGG